MGCYRFAGSEVPVNLIEVQDPRKSSQDTESVITYSKKQGSHMSEKEEKKRRKGRRQKLDKCPRM